MGVDRFIALSPFCSSFYVTEISRWKNISKLASNIFNKYFDVFTLIIHSNDDVSRECCKIHFQYGAVSSFHFEKQTSKGNGANLSEHAIKKIIELIKRSNEFIWVHRLIPFVEHFIRVKASDVLSPFISVNLRGKCARRITTKSWRATNECH